jgi:PAS domain S-box-containing protein
MVQVFASHVIMEIPLDPNTQLDIEQLRTRLRTLRQSVDEMDLFLEHYATVEHALRESEERFRLLVEGVRDYAIFMLDTTGHITSWNTGAQLIKGYTASEIIGQHFSIFYPPEDIAAEKPERELRIATAEGKYEEEGWRLHKDGSQFWAHVLITALYDSQGVLRGFGKVTRNMTDRKRAQEQAEQLRERNQQLQLEQVARSQSERLVQLQDEFLAIAAHELRTPLTALLGNAQLLRRRAHRGIVLSEQDQQKMDVIIEQAERLNRMVLTLLDLSRVQMGQLHIERTSLDLVSLARRIVEVVQPTLKHHTIEYRGEDGPIVVDGDVLRLEQVVHNLVQNAIKYSPAGGPVSIQVTRHDTMVSLAVTDQGIGIPKRSLPNIFQRFYRATNVDGRYISGLGVGLYVVKDVVTQHGGRVEVATIEGQGSTFTVRLPLPGHELTASDPDAQAQSGRTEGAVLQAADELTVRTEARPCAHGGHGSGI